MFERNTTKVFIKSLTTLITATLLIFIIYALKLGLFEDKTLLISYIKKFGITAPIIFILFQIFQVLIPIIPGGATSLTGVLMFGSLNGFIYNYIGLVLGSIIVFNISKKYGSKIIEKFFPKETIEKYLTYIKNNNFEKIFFLGILFPGFPDDLLCYIAGISKIKFQKFITIILIGKSLSLLTYSIFMILI